MVYKSNSTCLDGDEKKHHTHLLLTWREWQAKPIPCFSIKTQISAFDQPDSCNPSIVTKIDLWSSTITPFHHQLRIKLVQLIRIYRENINIALKICGYRR